MGDTVSAPAYDEELDISIANYKTAKQKALNYVKFLLGTKYDSSKDDENKFTSGAWDSDPYFMQESRNKSEHNRVLEKHQKSKQVKPFCQITHSSDLTENGTIQNGIKPLFNSSAGIECQPYKGFSSSSSSSVDITKNPFLTSNDGKLLTLLDKIFDFLQKSESSNAITLYQLPDFEVHELNGILTLDKLKDKGHRTFNLLKYFDIKKKRQERYIRSRITRNNSFYIRIRIRIRNKRQKNKNTLCNHNF